MNNSDNNFKLKVTAGILIGIAVILVFVCVILMLDNKKGDSAQGNGKSETSTQIRNIDEEPEIGEQLNLVGFYKLKELGLMASQYEKTLSTIRTYVETNAPKAKLATYKEGSFRYIENNKTVMEFEFLVDSSDMYNVRLNTGGSIKNVEITIFKVE